MELKFRIWDSENVKFVKPTGKISLEKMIASDRYKVDLFSGITMRDGTEVWENDIIYYERASAFKRHWSSITDIPEIERIHLEQMSKKTTYYEVVKFRDGAFKAGELDAHTILRGGKESVEDRIGGDLHVSTTNLRVIGNVWEIPELYVSERWNGFSDREKWERYKWYKGSSRLKFVCGSCHEYADEPQTIAIGGLHCENCDYMLTKGTPGGQHPVFNWFAKFTHEHTK